MNYQLIYDKLIAQGKAERFPLSHGHHIVPKHSGGTDDEWNIVFLTVKQHTLAHRLLWKVFKNPYDQLAWKGLSGCIGAEQIQLEAVRIANTGKVFSEEHRRKLSIAGQGRKDSEQTKQLKSLTKMGELNPRFGKPQTELQKQKLMEAQKGSKRSEETKQKMRDAWIRRKEREVVNG